jgi:hypothetical protein
MKRLLLAVCSLGLAAPLAAHAQSAAPVYQTPQSIGAAMLNSARQTGQNAVNADEQNARNQMNARTEAMRRNTTSRMQGATNAYQQKRQQVDQTRQAVRNLTTMPGM